jgi:thioredoxin-like negative regulator of GroEL
LVAFFAGKSSYVSGAKDPLLLFFSSIRSGPCRRMESVLAQLARTERSRVDVARIDVDEREDVAEQFAISTVPSLVLVVDRRAVARIEGRASATKIARLLDAHLDTRSPA